jgi:MazG nucleotide pyrophosphohydrolase domain.
MSTLYELQDDVVNWADSISPNRKPKDAVVKLVSEASELLDAVLNNGNVEQELGDCLILMCDLAEMYNVDLVEAAVLKMNINRNRDWRAENGVIRRDRHNGS